MCVASSGFFAPPIYFKKRFCHQREDYRWFHCSPYFSIGNIAVLPIVLGWIKVPTRLLEISEQVFWCRSHHLNLTPFFSLGKGRNEGKEKEVCHDAAGTYLCGNYRHNFIGRTTLVGVIVVGKIIVIIGNRYSRSIRRFYPNNACLNKFLGFGFRPTTRAVVLLLVFVPILSCSSTHVEQRGVSESVIVCCVPFFVGFGLVVFVSGVSRLPSDRFLPTLDQPSHHAHNIKEA